MMINPTSLYVYNYRTLFFTQGLSAKCIVRLSELLYARFFIEVSDKENSAFKGEAQYIPELVTTIATPYFVYNSSEDLEQV